MAQTGSRSSRRAAFLGAASIALVVVLAACGSSASPSTSASTAPSIAPSVAAPSVEPSVAPPSAEPSVAPASVTPSGGGGTATDPAEGLKIGAPYAIVALPAAAQQVFETQMSTSLGALGSNISFGFRSITGGKGQNILMVLAFPAGTMSASVFTGMVGGMGASMGATLTKTTSGGVDIYAGASSTGGVGIFHVGDHAIIVISEKSDDALQVAEALVAANQ